MYSARCSGDNFTGCDGGLKLICGYSLFAFRCNRLFIESEKDSIRSTKRALLSFSVIERMSLSEKRERLELETRCQSTPQSFSNLVSLTVLFFRLVQVLLRQMRRTSDHDILPWEQDLQEIPCLELHGLLTSRPCRFYSRWYEQEDPEFPLNPSSLGAMRIAIAIVFATGQDDQVHVGRTRP